MCSSIMGFCLKEEVFKPCKASIRGCTYLEADVRRNGRKEARREVTLPWFQEEGSQPSQLGVYRIILFDHFS